MYTIESELIFENTILDIIEENRWLRRELKDKKQEVKELRKRLDERDAYTMDSMNRLSDFCGRYLDGDLPEKVMHKMDALLEKKS